MILYVELFTDALGKTNYQGWYLSPDQLKDGVEIRSLLPDAYLEYVHSIKVCVSSDGNRMEINSEKYGDANLSVDEDETWTTPRIGLSYAWCTIALKVIPLFRNVWDQLCVTHEGATEVYQREEIRYGVNLAKLSPRPDGSLIPWLNADVYKVDDRHVELLLPKGHISVNIGERVTFGEESYELRCFSVCITEWDEVEQKPISVIVDSKDLLDSIKDGEAALRVAEQVQEQQPENLELIAKYMGFAADLGNKDALAWLKDYYDGDSRWDAYC